MLLSQLVVFVPFNSFCVRLDPDLLAVLLLLQASLVPFQGCFEHLLLVWVLVLLYATVELRFHVLGVKQRLDRGSTRVGKEHVALDGRCLIRELRERAEALGIIRCSEARLDVEVVWTALHAPRLPHMVEVGLHFVLQLRAEDSSMLLYGLA